jgi:hypothetical protein
MTVIAFPPKPPRADASWRAGELDAMVAALAPALTGGGSGWYDIGFTEIGDPQLYLLGPPPHDECILCISRLGRTYVLEDGAGHVLCEHDSLLVLAEQAKSALRRRKAQIVARAVLVWCAARAAFEEKLEAVAGEGEELLAHVVPQLAALA